MLSILYEFHYIISNYVEDEKQININIFIYNTEFVVFLVSDDWYMEELILIVFENRNELKTLNVL